MSNNKMDFVQELLNSKKLDNYKKERIFTLTAKELGKDSREIEKIWVEIENLKTNKKKEDNGNVETIQINSILSEKNEILISKSIKYIKPEYLSKFLKAYNQDPILKTTCHEIDEDELNKILKITSETIYNYEKHLEKIVVAYTKLEKSNFADSKVKALIRGYLTGKNYIGEPISGWSTNNISINWSSKDILEWSNKNPGVPPNLDRSLQNIFHSQGYRIDSETLNLKTFTDLVIYFKKLFHIRSDNSLKCILLDMNIKNNWIDEIEFEIDEAEFRDNIEFFTDVDKLKQAYKRLIELVLAVVKENNLPKPKVKLTLMEEDNNITFSILHINTTFKKTAQNLIERTSQKLFNLIKNQINGLCDFYIIADFGANEFGEINYWNGDALEYKFLKNFEGVEYKLIFKK